MSDAAKDSDTRARDMKITVSLVRSIISSEFRELKRDLNINNANSKSAFLKRKYSDDSCEYKYSGNKKNRLTYFNVSILNNCLLKILSKNKSVLLKR